MPLRGTAGKSLEWLETVTFKERGSEERVAALFFRSKLTCIFSVIGEVCRSWFCW